VTWYAATLPPVMDLQFRSSAVFGKLEFYLAIIIPRSSLARCSNDWRSYPSCGSNSLF